MTGFAFWHRALGVLCAISPATLMGLSAPAAPVTFAFTAEVTGIDVLSSAVLPFTVNVGDQIHGRFTFEPVDAASNVSNTDTVQSLGISFDLGPTVLASADYFLRVRNNSPVIDAPELTTDDIRLGCNSVGVNMCHPNNVPSTTDFIWWFNLPLVGDGSILDGADIPDDPTVWKNLTPAYLSLTFQEMNVADALRITARVNGFAVVPEPTTAMISLFSLLPMYFVASGRCSRPN